MRKLLFAAMLLTACSPGGNSPPEGPSPFPPFLSLPVYFDCIGELGLTQIAAHRGGPAPGYPENALATFERTYGETGAFLEVDVATSADGVLFLHHDDNLGRTTTGRGPAAEKSWDELRALSLKDDQGKVTAYGLTRLDEALEWAKGKTVLELDIKPSTDYDDVAKAVRDAGAEDWVILIAYTENSAIALSKRFPDSMISVSVNSADDIDRLVDRGMKRENILAWTGIEAPNGPLSQALQSEGIEAIFGTLGGRDSLDNQYAASRNDEGYVDISKLGIDLIATDRPEAAAEALMAAGRFASPSACPASN
ncbi:glycerophosphodiester phosphodiesterase family protein [Parvularcula marina]|uniref:Glycerophosphodiester phosphodiesterase n=1 Tax=Parvularcula marina TaxID=2292771 RepID=A0A371RIY3_9PROT|nr:glycerophosphodiester phosphodiesterase family protein [Parvularcula marina]RFB05417.1 glycerophosphodiester phosphodiesterase [Parvularcula marina]